MKLPRFLILLIFFTLLSSSITSAFECPAGQDLFLVILKPNGLIGIVLTLAQIILELLNRGFQVVKFKPGEGIFGDEVVNPNIITDISVTGVNGILVGCFSPNVVTELLGLVGVDFVEKVFDINADNPPTLERRRRKRTVQTSAPFNLDRIDQRDFPLNGNYNFPNNAGSESNIFVIDTGIDLENVEFEGRASFGGAFCDNCSSTDDHGHGTNIAGIIGGKKFGVAKKTKLIALKVFNQNGQGNSATVAAGISFAISKHKASANKNSIINLSFASGFSAALNKIATDAVNAGIHVVTAAGDSTADACDVSPATVPQVITVGATEKTTNDATTTTNTGVCVDFFAPGRDIIAAGAGLDNALSKASGSGQACSHVAGTIALIISKQGNASPSSMTNTLINLSTKNTLSSTIDASPNRFLFVPTP